MTPKQIVHEVKSRVIALAEKYPNAVYNSPRENGDCFYDEGSVTEGPEGVGCIYGHVCRDMGIDIPPSCEDGIIAILERQFDQLYYSPVWEKNKLWIGSLQIQQDTGLSWGRAVEIVNETYPETENI